MRKWLAFASLAVVCMVGPSAAVAQPRSSDRWVTGPTSGKTTVDLAAGTSKSHGTARLSNIGRTRYRLDGNFVFVNPTTVSASGTGILTAANGDRLFSTFTGTINEIVVNESSHSTLVFTVTGGTGRFKDATGTLTSEAEGVVIWSDLAAGVFVSRDSGTLSGRISLARLQHRPECGPRGHRGGSRSRQGGYR